MKRSPFSLVSLVAGVLLVVPAILIAVADGLQLSESHPFVAFAFPVVLVFSLFEAPVQAFNVPVAFPVVLPLVSVLTGIAGFARNEVGKKMAVGGIVLTVVSLAIHAAVRFLYA